MRYLLYLIVFFVVGQSVAQSPEDAIQDFFAAFHRRDTSALRKVMHPQLVLQTVAFRNNRVVTDTETVYDFLRSIQEIPNGIDFREELGQLATQEDELLAQVWVPYRFYLNGNLSHEGVNSFVLVKEKETWQVIHLVDTRKLPVQTTHD